MKIAMFSGGKESLYASTKAGPIDAYIMLVYQFPEPSPHLVNLGPSIQTGLLTDKPVFVKRLTKGREFSETVEFLRFLNTDVIVAGDVYVEEHLKYLQNIAKEVGATLKEPLWNMNSSELLHKEIEYGIEARIIGAIHGLGELLGKILKQESFEELVKYITGKKADVLGENGEYHTIVEYSPIHIARLKYNIVRKRTTGRGVLLELTLL